MGAEIAAGVYGEWRFDPPLMEEDLQSLPNDLRVLRVRVEFDAEGLRSARRVRRWGIAIEPASAEEASHLDLIHELETLLKAFGSARHIGGYIVRIGSGRLDAERYWPGPRFTVRTEQAELRWSDGTRLAT